MTKYLKVKFNMPGFHHWKDAPHKWDYLRRPHRHQFYWTIMVAVEDSDREIEFIDFNSWIKSRIEYIFGTHETLLGHYQFGGRSCETLAEMTYIIIRLNTKDVKVHSVEVSEDNENGAVIFFNNREITANDKRKIQEARY